MKKINVFISDKNILSQLIIIIIPIIFFWEPIIQQKILYWGTTSTQFFPWMEYAIQELLRGGLPLWNPYNGWGSPLMANYQSALIYPPNWLLIIFYLIEPLKGLYFGYTVLLIIHLQIGGLGFYRLLSKFDLNSTSKLIGSITFIFSGYLLSRINFISMIWAMVWIPWIIAGVINEFSNYKFAKKSINIQIILPVSLQLLAGHAQTAYYTILITCIYFVILWASHSHKLKRALKFILSILFSAGICAIQLIPTAEYLYHSQRSKEVGFDFAANFSFWPWRLLSSVFPDFWGNPIYGRYLGGGNYWEDHIYLGVISLILILFAYFILFRSKDPLPEIELKFYRTSMILIPISFLMALGKNFFVYPFFYKYVPTFDMFQAPSRFLLVYAFCGAVLAAVGFEFWIKKKIPGKKTGVFIFIFVAIILGVFISEKSLDVLPKSIELSIYLGSGFAIIFGLLSILKNVVSLNWVKVIKGAIMTLIIFDLFFFLSQNNLFKQIDYYDEIHEQNKSLTSEVVFLENKTEEFIKFNQNFRFDRFQDFGDNSSGDLLFLPNTNLFSPQYHMINNFDPFIPGNYAKFLNGLNTLSEAKQKEVLTKMGTSVYVSLDPPFPNGLDIVSLENADMVQWYDCALSRPADEILNDLLYNEAFFEKERCLTISGTTQKIETDTGGSAPSSVKLTYKINPSHQYQIQYESENEGWLLIRSNYYPGWKAVVDQDSIIKTEEADFLFTGILVPAGKHEIIFSYAPLSFYLGAGISLLSILIALMLYRKNI